MMGISIIVGSFSTDYIDLEERLRELEIRGGIETIKIVVEVS